MIPTHESPRQSSRIWSASRSLMGRLTAPLRAGATWMRLGVAAGGLLGVLVLIGVIPFPSVGDLLADLSDSLGAWTYLLVPALAFFETAAFLGRVVPGETAVLVGGVVAERGEVSLAVLIALVWSMAVAGDLVAFLFGRRLGGAFLRRHAGRLRVKVEHIERVERLFEQHGGKAIVVGRFVGVLRAFTPFVAGTSGMTLRRFVPYSVGAAFAWTTGLVLVGFAFSNSVDTAGGVITKVTIAPALLVGLAVWVRSARRSRARRDDVRPRRRTPRVPARAT